MANIYHNIDKNKFYCDNFNHIYCITMESAENQRIELLRKFLKMSQTEFAKSIGMSQSNYNMAIKEGRNISGKPIYLLQSVHKVNLDWIFGKIESEVPVFMKDDNKEDIEKRELERTVMKLQAELLEYKTRENESLKNHPTVPAGQ